MRGVLDGRVTLAGLCVAFVAGAAAQLQQAALADPAAVWGVGAAVLVLLAGAVRWRRRRPMGAALLGLCAAGLLGWATTEGRAAARLAERLDPRLDGREVTVVGTVADLPRLQPLGTRFEIAVESARDPSGPVTVPPRLSLGWTPGGEAGMPLAPWPRELVAGDRWQFVVRLRTIHGSMNPHGFDFEGWMFEQGIGGSGTVRPGAQWLGPSSHHAVDRWRQGVRDRLLTRVTDPTAAGVLAALAVGDQAAIPPADWELFRITGVAHLMSISGLHVTLFAWMAGGLIGVAWRTSPRAMLAVPTPLASAWGGLACAAGYTLIAGWGVPAQRTLGLLAAWVLLRTLGLRWPAWLMLAVAGWAVVAGDPWALRQPGFWLSFVAVGLLFASSPAGSGQDGGWRVRLREAARTQAVATVGLAPLTIVFFQQLSLVGFVANALAIPLVTLVITPLALAGAVLAPLWQAAELGVSGLRSALDVAATPAWAVWAAAAPAPWAAAAGLLGGALAVMPLPVRLRLLAVPLMLPIVWPAVERPLPGEFELVAADVGQGTAVLVRTASHLLVYDTGPVYSPLADAGERVLVPLLRARGEARVDRLVLSHRDTDHVGGAASLERALSVRSWRSSLEEGHPLRGGRAAHQDCRDGETWVWDGVHFAFLHPTAEALASAAASPRTTPPNALSCVLRVTAADGRRALLTGDLEAAQEEALVKRSPPGALASEVLLVPHHGSRTSSTPAFLEAVVPRYAVVQSGWRSRFGHPAPEVVTRYEALGVRVVRTDTCGAWRWPHTVCERESRRRYWHHADAAGAAAVP